MADTINDVRMDMALSNEEYYGKHGMVDDTPGRHMLKRTLMVVAGNDVVNPVHPGDFFVTTGLDAVFFCDAVDGGYVKTGNVKFDERSCGRYTDSDKRLKEDCRLDFREYMRKWNVPQHEVVPHSLWRRFMLFGWTGPFEKFDSEVLSKDVRPGDFFISADSSVVLVCEGRDGKCVVSTDGSLYDENSVAVFVDAESAIADDSTMKASDYRAKWGCEDVGRHIGQRRSKLSDSFEKVSGDSRLPSEEYAGMYGIDDLDMCAHLAWRNAKLHGTEDWDFQEWKKWWRSVDVENGDMFIVNGDPQVHNCCKADGRHVWSWDGEFYQDECTPWYDGEDEMAEDMELTDREYAERYGVPPSARDAHMEMRKSLLGTPGEKPVLRSLLEQALEELDKMGL